MGNQAFQSAMITVKDVYSFTLYLINVHVVFFVLFKATVHY